MEGEGGGRGQQSGIDQRSRGEDKARGVTARVRDPRRLADGLPLLGTEFGQAVDPIVRHSVRGAGVEDPGAPLACPLGGFPRGVVGKAQEGDISRGDLFAPGLGILPLRFVQGGEGEILAVGQPLPNPQARCPRMSVDVDPVCHWGESSAGQRLTRGLRLAFLRANPSFFAGEPFGFLAGLPFCFLGG